MHLSRHVALAGLLAAVGLAGCGGGDDQTSTPSTAASVSAPAAQPAVAQVVVPNLIGVRQDDAHRIVARAGLRLRWAGFAGKLANGRYEISCVKVLRQSPVGGERIRRGGSITVIEDACEVPQERPHGI